jgi:hypothetical protein
VLDFPATRLTDRSINGAGAQGGRAEIIDRL